MATLNPYVKCDPFCALCQEALAFEEYKRRLASVHGISAATVVKISAKFPSAAALCQAESSKVFFFWIQQSLSDFESTELSKKRFSLVGLSINNLQDWSETDEVWWSRCLVLGHVLRIGTFFRFSGQQKILPVCLAYVKAKYPVSQTFYTSWNLILQRRPSSLSKAPFMMSIFTTYSFNLTQQCCGMSTLLWCGTVALGDKYIGGSPTKFNTTNEGQYSSAWLWPCRLWSEKTVQIQFLAQCRWQRSHFQQRWIWSLSLWMAALSTWQGLWKTSQRQGFGNWQCQPSGLGPLHLKLT